MVVKVGCVDFNNAARALRLPRSHVPKIAFVVLNSFPTRYFYAGLHG